MGLSRTENPIHCLLKPHADGGYVLLTVNLEDTVETARFTFSTQLAALEKLFENQPAPCCLMMARRSKIASSRSRFMSTD